MMQVQRSILAIVLALTLLLTLAGTALGAANPGASCIGFGSSQAATSAAGERAAIAHEVIDVEAPALGLTPGGLYSHFAKLHLGDLCFAEEG